MDSYIAEDEENFILISPDYNKIHWAQILVNVKLKNTEAVIDRADPRVLIVAIKVKVIENLLECYICRTNLLIN